MDLNKFIKKNEKDTKIEYLKKDKNKEIFIENNKIIFKFSNLSDIQKYEKFMFFAPSESIIVNSEEEIEAFFEKSIKNNVEGLMLKSLTEPYKPGLRVGSMYKLKKESEEIDVVILAGVYGKGKRGGFISSFIVGVKDDLTDEFLAIGKVASGLKEDESEISIKKLTELLEKYKIGEDEDMVYYEPKIVIEVKYQEIMKSNKYDSGFALRFPRILRLREDKDVNEIASLKEIKEFYSK